MPEFRRELGGGWCIGVAGRDLGWIFGCGWVGTWLELGIGVGLCAWLFEGDRELFGYFWFFLLAHNVYLIDGCWSEERLIF